MFNKIIKITALLASFTAITMFSSFSLAAQKNPHQDNYFDTQFVYEAKVLIDTKRVTVGQSKYGERGIVWITGGTFKGPHIKGTVLPGGGDWQLGRPDGTKELDAKYVLKTDDGVIILVRNKVILGTEPTKGESTHRYARSVLTFEAPLKSKYAWMNSAVFLGTLDRSPTYDKEPAVIIRVWKVL